MDTKYDAIVLTGRFQPVHNVHIELMHQAKSLAKNLIIIIGSADQPRTHKNPFTYNERELMIRKALKDSGFSPGDLFNTMIRSNIDTRYDDAAWVIRVQNIVNKITEPGQKIGIIGSEKDLKTKEYLDMFPQWERVAFPHKEIMNATDIRDIYFDRKKNNKFLKSVVPPSTYEFLEAFKETDEYNLLCDEKEFIEAYIKRKEVYEYPIIAVTVDAVVVQSGHVLLIKRRSIPGKGLWALPGGYFDAVKDKTPLDGILRELKEETKIDVPSKVLEGSLKSIDVFAAPDRSLLGRSITFAGHIVLKDSDKLPKINGSDDAEKARWVPLADVKRSMLFDDHFDILAHHYSSIGG